MKSNNTSPNVWGVLLLRLYLVYAILMFVLTFLMAAPVFLLAALIQSDTLGIRINHYWSHVFFFLIGVPMEVTLQTALDKKANYIFCPNHFSFLDIAIMPFMPVPFKFVGKVSIAKVPLLGMVFKKFHITVDRARLRDRYATYTRSISALMAGYSLAIFPEGGIRSEQPPILSSFKEGPFRMAIETGTPLVPVTLADNWHIFPDDGRFFLRRRKCRVVVHSPIDPAGYTMSSISEFQEDVRRLIQEELNQRNA